MSTKTTLTAAQKIANLNSDSRKLSHLIADLRTISFASLCPAGRAEVAAALAALNRADQECDEQIGRVQIEARLPHVG